MPKSTRHFRLDADSPDAESIEIASRTIHAGGLVAFPTETVYGLGANAWDEAAVSRIFRAKGRPANDPLIVHIACIGQLSQITREIAPAAQALCRRFWPGPLTLVLKKAVAIPDNLTAGLDSVAVRMPDHEVALALLKAADVPIAAPSANRFSRPSPTCAQHVLDDLKGKVDVLLDAGSTTIGVESTILSLVGDYPRVLRPGGVSVEALREVVPNLCYEPRFLSDEAVAAPTPGSMLRHYSPRARVMLFQGDDDAAVHAAMRAEIIRHDKVAVMALDADAAHFDCFNIRVERLGSSAEAAALRLFAALRSLDKEGVDFILVRAPAKEGLGLAIRDRLLRAAEGSLVEV